VDQVDPGKVEEDMVLEETERWPGWSRTTGRLPRSYWDRLKGEWDLADLVLVNSEWSANALIQQGVPSEKIIIVPLAIDVSATQHSEPIIAKGTLKVLWLGSVILRKGVQYLVEAAKKLQSQNIEFLLAGPLGISDRVVREFPSNIKLLGRITRDHLSRVYREAHIFVLPTISDGFAVTQLEAMEHGLPVIATPNCGNVVTDGVDGFIVPAREGDSLAAAIARLDSDRKLVREMSCNALKTIRKYDLQSNARMIHELTLRRRTAAQSERVPSYA
jgi:glycosyltransferase involved in cell wall biosynthesis